MRSLANGGRASGKIVFHKKVTPKWDIDRSVQPPRNPYVAFDPMGGGGERLICIAIATAGICGLAPLASVGW